MRTVAPVSPGEMLRAEFLEPLGLSRYRLAKDIGVPPQRIGDIVAGKRSITADTDLRLCRYFGLSDGWWLRGQASYDTAVAKEAMREERSRIQRCSLLVAQACVQPTAKSIGPRRCFGPSEAPVNSTITRAVPAAGNNASEPGDGFSSAASP